MARTVSYRETLAIRGFLVYLQQHYAKSINVNDALTIAAISAWIAVESGGFGHIRYNNPFNLHGPRRIIIVGGKKRLGPPGRLLRFATLAKGFEALAKVLMNSPKGSMYAIALNALKRGGNNAAADFLAAIAMSQFDAGHYGANDWLQAYDANHNRLLAAYLKIGGVQLLNPRVSRPKPVPPPPKLPRDFNYRVVVRDYLDPWAAGRLYASRHRGPVQSVDLRFRG